MTILDSVSVKARMIFSFLFIAALILAFGLISLKEMRTLGDLTSTLYEHPLRVSNAALQARNSVVSMHRFMKDVILAQNELELMEAVARVREDEQNVLEQLDIVDAYILGEEGLALAREARQAFVDWRPIRASIQKLISEGDSDEAARISMEEGAGHVALLEEKMRQLTAYARNKADGFMANALEVQDKITTTTVTTMLLVIVMLFMVAVMVIWSMVGRLNELQHKMRAISETGRLVEVPVYGSNEIAALAGSFNELVRSLRRQFWLREGLNSLNDEVSSHDSGAGLSRAALSFICRHMEACAGAVYEYDPKDRVNVRVAAFAGPGTGRSGERFENGQGVVGQVAVEMKPLLVAGITGDDAVLESGTACGPARAIYAVPMLVGRELNGVVEVASMTPVDPIRQEFMNQAAQVLSAALNRLAQRERIDSLYARSRMTNEELESQGLALRNANEQLAMRNEELQAQSRELTKQAGELKVQANALKEQKEELEIRRQQVEEADRLKTEFLSNMSHELRTPLNSIMALSQLMKAKGTGRDPAKEGEYLGVIERNGRHLLKLINDILDLAKIESGRMDLSTMAFSPEALMEEVASTMRPMAGDRKLDLRLTAEAVGTIVSDRDKILQVMLNLVSNAIKFTEEGEVDLSLRREGGDLVFTVGDTGIGIPADKLDTIFDKFRQVDGSTTRRHDGSGLGLTISRKMAALLGGRLEVESEPGRGSVFALRLPMERPVAPETMIQGSRTGAGERFAQRNRDGRTVLVVDDDRNSRVAIREYLVQSGYDVIEAENGQEGLRLAEMEKPFAMTLDIIMPGMDGWEVLRQLKLSPETEGIPVIIVSMSDDQTTGMALGASGFVTKPMDREVFLAEMRRLDRAGQVRTVLIVDDDPLVRERMDTFLSEAGYVTVMAADGREGLDKARMLRPDAMVLDLVMPDMDGFSVLEELSGFPEFDSLPVLVVTARDLDREEKLSLMKRSLNIIGKGDMDLQTMFGKVQRELWAIEGKRPAASSPMPSGRVLVVEDNATTVRQITSVLEELGLQVDVARDGEEALEKLEKNMPHAALLDMMMPGMDVLEVLEAIRSVPQGGALPVVVLTPRELNGEERSGLGQDNIFECLRQGSLDRSRLKCIVMEALQPGSGDPGTDGRSVQAGDMVEPEDVSLQHLSGTVLVVEDNEDNLTTIRAVLQDFRGKLEVARDGESGVAMARELIPDLILMDIQLPGMSGLEALRRIRSHPPLAGIPVIALTARAMPRDRSEMLAAGMDGIMTKPFDYMALRATLCSYLGQ